jgi:PAS domain S-box-containing protein
MKNTNRKLTIDLHAIGEAALAADADRNIIWMNPDAEQLTGWPVEDAIGRSLDEVMIVFDVTGSVPIRIPSTEDLLSGRNTNCPERISLRSTDGRVRQVNWMVTPVHDEDDPRRGIGLVFRDMTDELRRQKMLDEERIYLSTAIKAASIGTWSWNLPTGELTVNERWAEMIGYRRDELLPTTFEAWRTLVHPDDEPGIAHQLAQHFAGKIDYYVCEFRLRHKQGHWVWVQSTGKVYSWRDDEPLMIYGANVETTQRRKAEEAVLESEAHLQGVLNSIFAWVGVLAPTGQITWVNRAPRQEAGVENVELVGTYIWDAIWYEDLPDSKAQVREACLRAAAGEQTRFDVMIRGADGQPSPIDLMIAPLFDESGKVTHIIPSAIDISERYQALTELQEIRGKLERHNVELERRIAERTKELSASEQLCRSTIECSAIATTLASPNGQWLAINQAAVDFLGYSRSELREFSTQDVSHPEDRELESEYLAKLLRGELENYALEKRYIHKQGHVVWGLVNVAVFRDEAGNASHLIRQTQNITARKQKDEALCVNLSPYTECVR